MHINTPTHICPALITLTSVSCWRYPGTRQYWDFESRHGRKLFSSLKQRSNHPLITIKPSRQQLQTRGDILKTLWMVPTPSLPPSHHLMFNTNQASHRPTFTAPTQNSAAGPVRVQTVSFALYQTSQKQQRLIEPQFAASFLQGAKQRMGRPGLSFCAKAADQREHIHTYTLTHIYTQPG